MRIYIKKIKDGFLYSLAGFRFALLEKAFQIELLAAFIILPAIFFFNISSAEKCVLVSALFLVLITEIINSAIEKTLDRISIQQHKTTKHAKDMASCAVFLV